MSQRIVLSLSGITMLLIIFIGAILFWETQSGVEDGFREAPQPAWADHLASRLDTVRIIRIERKGEEITLERHKGAWGLSQFHGYPVHADTVTDQLGKLGRLEGHFVSEEPMPHARYGVANAPGSSVGTGTALDLIDGEGQVLEALVIGQTVNVPTDGGLMEVQAIRRADEGRIWLFSPAVRLSLWHANWIDTTIVRVPSSEVTKLSVISRGNPGETWGLKRTTSKEIISAGAQGDTLLSGRENVEAERLMGGLANLRFDDVRQISPKEMTENWQWQTSIETVERIVYDVHIWTEDGIHWVTIMARPAENSGNKDAEKISNFNDRHNEWAYQLSPVVAENLIIQQQDFR